MEDRRKKRKNELFNELTTLREEGDELYVAILNRRQKLQAMKGVMNKMLADDARDSKRMGVISIKVEQIKDEIRELE